MIGQVLLERQRFPIAAGLCMVAALASVVIAAVSRDWNWGLFAVLPAICGIALLIARPTPFRADLTADGILLDSGAWLIRYDAISQVIALGGDRPGNGPLFVTHDGGQLTIPSDVGVNSTDIHEFLTSAAPVRPPPPLPSALSDYCRAQVATFGAEKVWVHAARSIVRLQPSQVGKFLGPAIMLCAIAWFSIGATRDQLGWTFAAMGLALFVALPVWISGYRSPKQFLGGEDALGGLAAFALFGVIGASIWSSNRAKRAKLLRDACMVISPGGIGLSQADLKGHLRWSEVKNVALRSRWSQNNRVELRIEGAKINILDVYRSPLREIHRQIMHYWEAG